MAYTIRNVLVLAFVFLACISESIAKSSSTNGQGDKYVREACSVTRYRDLCIHSLSSFSSAAKSSPTKWARAGVSVTLSEAKNVLNYLLKLKKLKSRGIVGGKSGSIALSDCVECLQDAFDQLHKSLSIIRKIDAYGYYAGMGDLLTWMSAVLTYEDTCLDGFEGKNGRAVGVIKSQVLRVSYVTSNALALVNKLASTGVGSQPSN